MANLEDNGFLDQKDVVFETYDGKSSFKTNLLIFSNNWKMLTQYLINFKSYVKYLSSLIDIENLVKIVSENFQNSKASLPILFTMPVSGIENILINSTRYKIERISEYIIEISNLSSPDWFVDKLIVQVKDVDGTIIYPVIITKNNKITIHFIDGITSNYSVLFV